MSKFLCVSRPPSMPRERDKNTSGPFENCSDSERRLELSFTFQIAHSSDSYWQETAGSLEGDCVKCLMRPLEPCNRRGCRTEMRRVQRTRGFLFHRMCRILHWEDKKCAKTKLFAPGDFELLPVSKGPRWSISSYIFYSSALLAVIDKIIMYCIGRQKLCSCFTAGKFSEKVMHSITRCTDALHTSRFFFFKSS